MESLLAREPDAHEANRARSGRASCSRRTVSDGAETRTDESVARAIEDCGPKARKVIVASDAFSVDDTEAEEHV